MVVVSLRMCIDRCRFYISPGSRIVNPVVGPVAGDEQGLFAISVAAERADLAIQNLRVYERRGLLEPARTAGGTRLYSEADIVVLRRIGELLSEGLNLAGIRKVLELESQVAQLRGSPTSQGPQDTGREG